MVCLGLVSMSQTVELTVFKFNIESTIYKLSGYLSLLSTATSVQYNFPFRAPVRNF